MLLQEIMDEYRASARTEREKVDYSERLVRVFMENDDTQRQYYWKVAPFADWATSQGGSNADTGIDLVGTLSDGSGYVAIQCKFYALNHSIQKPDIDSFISAASIDLFSRLVIADTTLKELGRIDWSQCIRSGTVSLAPKKQLRKNQRDALREVQAGPGKRVLFMVPSLALMSQTVREWKNDSEYVFTAFTACFDLKVGRQGQGKGSHDRDL